LLLNCFLSSFPNEKILYGNKNRSEDFSQKQKQDISKLIFILHIAYCILHIVPNHVMCTNIMANEILRFIRYTQYTDSCYVWCFSYLINLLLMFSSAVQKYKYEDKWGYDCQKNRELDISFFVGILLVLLGVPNLLRVQSFFIYNYLVYQVVWKAWYLK
jgi:hypothetical protein